ncbi:MAG: carboxypeptidase regulatory-like domain-containing protein, partial [Fidelibacterota bacterium]
MIQANAIKRNTGFLVAVLAMVSLWSSVGMAKEIHPVRSGQKELTAATKDEIVQKRSNRAVDEIQVKEEALDVERINEIRLKKDEAAQRLQRARNRMKIQELSKIRQQTDSSHRPRSGATPRMPSLGDLFKVGTEPARKHLIRETHSQGILGRSSDSIYVSVNGVDADTIIQGSDFVATIHFSSGASEADVSFWVDMNANGTWEDSIDVDVGEGGHIVDNDEEDEDPADGVYEMTFYGDEDGPNRLGNLRAFFVAEDTSGSDAAYLFIEPMATDYSVSGSVTPDTANVLVGAFRNDYDKEGSPWMTLTDSLGHYETFLPDSGYYTIFSFDFLDATGGMFPDTIYFDVFVDAHLTGYDFHYLAPNAWIEGTVTDEDSVGLAEIEVWAGREGGFGTWTETDTGGYYLLGVMDGDWWVGLEMEDLIPEYLVPEDEYVYVAEADTEVVDFVAHTTDATIEGMVTLEGEPIGDIGVGAWTEGFSWTETRTGPDGSYALHVSSEADHLGGYHVYAWDLPPDVIVDDYYDGVFSGARGIDFHLRRVLGAIEGIVYNSETSEPISEAWVSAWDGMNGYGAGSGPDGYYRLSLPNGAYEVDAGAEDYYPEFVGNVVISDNVIVLDIYLDPVSFDGSLSGFVYEPGSEVPVPDAEVDVGSEDYWDHAHTDSSGYYYFDLPNGVYWANAWKEGYTSDWVDSLVVDFDSVSHNFLIEPLVIDAAIEGAVTDEETGDPIIGAMVSAGSEIFWTETSTGSDGYFLMDVPGDTFWVDVFAEGYHPEFGLEVFVAAGDTAWLDVDLSPMRVEPPYIDSIGDVPNDQGRQVRITWWSGDPGEFGTWTKFSIWRLAPRKDERPPLWDFVAIVPFHGVEDYGFVAPTLVDSNQTTGEMDRFMSTFRVTAHTFDPWKFFDSEPMSGYS